jgi:hypothetical protein
MTGESPVEAGCEGVISAAVVERPGDEPRGVVDPLYLGCHGSHTDRAADVPKLASIGLTPKPVREVDHLAALTNNGSSRVQEKGIDSRSDGGRGVRAALVFTIRPGDAVEIGA